MGIDEDSIRRAAAALAQADALVVTAGAGMGVDSGLPDFRGPEGFWRAYPPYKALGLSFEDLANPRWFDRDPAFAWGFYGHRLLLYRRTKPHEGFAVLRRLAARARRGAFVFTSNVDGHFQAAGFDEERVVECHGAIRTLQCSRRCGRGLFSADGIDVDVDEETFRAREPLPRCACGAVARPNILMFGDWGWEDERTLAQQARLDAWLKGVVADEARVVVVECGAGTAIPTVRRFSESVADDTGGLLVRLNLRDPEVHGDHVGLAVAAKEGLLALERALPGG